MSLETFIFYLFFNIIALVLLYVKLKKFHLKSDKKSSQAKKENKKENKRRWSLLKKLKKTSNSIWDLFVGLISTL